MSSDLPEEHYEDPGPLKEEDAWPNLPKAYEAASAMNKKWVAVDLRSGELLQNEKGEVICGHDYGKVEDAAWGRYCLYEFTIFGPFPTTDTEQVSSQIKDLLA